MKQNTNKTHSTKAKMTKHKTPKVGRIKNVENAANKKWKMEGSRVAPRAAPCASNACHALTPNRCCCC